MRFPLLLALSAGLFTGCSPHDGEITGDYMAYFADASSQTLLKLKGKGVDFTSDTARENFNLTPIDCRLLAEEDEGQRLPGVDYEGDCLDENGDRLQAKWFTWLTGKDDYGLPGYAYYLKQEKVEPWRVEAVKTSEHDLQLTAHVDAGRLGDFRFGFVIDPTFQPEDCVDNGDGTASTQPIDGDWVQGWTDASREGTGTFYHLNAYAYQANPASTATYWGFDQKWYGGYAFGRFGDEELFGHQLDYNDPFLTADTPYGSPLYYLSYGDGEAVSTRRTADYAEWVAAFEEAFSGPNGDGTGEFNDLYNIGKADVPIDVRIENNAWRIADEAEAELESSNNYAYGLENWVGVSPTWVRFDQSPEEIRAIEPGVLDKPLTGSFLVFLEPLSSASKIFVQGNFTIDRIRADVWGYKRTLDEIKMDENNTPQCGDDRLTIEEE